MSMSATQLCNIMGHPTEQVGVLFAGREGVWGSPRHVFAVTTMHPRAVVSDEVCCVAQEGFYLCNNHPMSFLWSYIRRGCGGVASNINSQKGTHTTTNDRTQSTIAIVRCSLQPNTD